MRLNLGKTLELINLLNFNLGAQSNMTARILN